MTDSDSRSFPAPTPPPKPADAAAGEGLIDRFRVFLGLKPATTLRDDLAEELETADPESDFTPEERAMLKNILNLRRLRVGDVMVPRADIIAVPRSLSIGELLTAFANAGHSRLVVYGESLDDAVGMVHIRDLVVYLTRRATALGDAETRRKRRIGDYDPAALDMSQPLADADIIRPLLYVPPSMLAIDLLGKMQTTRIHLALVIDEYGGTDGLVSIEDTVEQVVGDIEDEHDEATGPTIAAQTDGTWIADARAGLEDAKLVLGEAFAEVEAAEDVNTIGGLVVTLAGRVPVRGDVVPGPDGFEFEVLEADPRRVKRLRIAPRGFVAARRRRTTTPDPAGERSAEGS